MQNVNEVKEMVAKELRSAGYEEFEVVETACTKPNDCGYRALTIKLPGMRACPNFNLDRFEDMMSKYTCGSVEEILKEAMRPVIEALSNPLQFEVDWFTNFENVKEALFLSICNQEGNEEFLSDIPHFLMEDLAFYARVLVSVPGEIGMDSVGSIVVHNNHLSNWGVSPEELLELAKVSTETVMPMEVCSMADILGGLGASDEDLASVDIRLWVSSNHKKIGGAVVISYPDFYKTVREKTGFEEFYVLPSSLHEIIIFPKEEKSLPEEEHEIMMLEAMVASANTTEVRPEELLSYHVYVYDKNGDFHIAGKKTMEKTA